MNEYIKELLKDSVQGMAIAFSAQSTQPLYLNPSVDWPDHRLIRKIIVWPCGCQTALYADDVRHWTQDRTLWSCDIHVMKEKGISNA